MKYCRLRSAQGPQYGLVEGPSGAEHITHRLASDGNGLPDPAGAVKMDAVPLSAASLLAPVEPSKIVCVGRNYLDHAKELGNDAPAEPLLFFKPPSSIIAPKDQIVRPKISESVHFEGELAVIVKKRCHKISDAADVRPFIFSYSCANDVTARDLQKKDNQWARAKGFDTFCPLGPVASDEVDPWSGVDVETRVNGIVKQLGNTKDFIFALDHVIRYIARVMTLLPGDIILTGTPAGVGPVIAGDIVTVSIPGIGSLTNPVVDEQ